MTSGPILSASRLPGFKAGLSLAVASCLLAMLAALHAPAVSAAATQVSGIEENRQAGQATFSVETAAAGTTSIQDVGYYTSPVGERDCSRVEGLYDRQARQVSAGRHQVDFAADSKRICLRVAYQAHPSAETGVDFHDFGVNAAGATTGGTDPSPSPAAGGSTETTCVDAANPDNCEARQTIDSALNLMAILVMPIVSIMIIIGGIQYSMAGNNSDAINAARGRIYKAILALICFVALWSFLKWLIPGGLE